MDAKLNRLGLAGMIALLIAAVIVPIAAAQPRVDLPQRFGVVDVDDAPAEARTLGAGWERITFDWAAFQPGGPDEFVSDAVDPDWLRAAEDDGREIVGLVVGTPGWASEAGTPEAVPAGLSLPVDDSGNTWARFFSQLVTYYAPRGVHRWIIYDEPDVPLGEGTVRFAGTVADYARLLQVAYQSGSEADPRLSLHVAAMNWWADVAAGRDPYLQRLITALAADPDAVAHGYYFDAVTLRVFTTTAALEEVVTAARAILDGAGLPDTAIWLETNASPALDPDDPSIAPLFGVTPEQQADFLVQAGALSLALGVQRTSVYRLADQPDDRQPWGLLRADGGRRPAFDAYQMVIDLFTPTLSVARFSNFAAEMIVLEQAGREVYVLWARGTSPVDFLITSGGVGELAHLYDSSGNGRPARSGDFVWPAAFTVSAAAAQRDSNGFLTVAGSPQVLVLDGTDADFFRVVYAVVDGETYRLK